MVCCETNAKSLSAVFASASVDDLFHLMRRKCSRRRRSDPSFRARRRRFARTCSSQRRIVASAAKTNDHPLSMPIVLPNHRRNFKSFALRRSMYEKSAIKALFSISSCTPPPPIDHQRVAFRRFLLMRDEKSERDDDDDDDDDEWWFSSTNAKQRSSL